MRTMVKLIALSCALVLGAGAAQAQVAPSGAGGGVSTADVRGNDSHDRNAANERDAEIAKQRGKREAKPKTARAVPAAPDDVTVGSEVRDSKGAVVGTIESVSMAAAVVLSAGGKVEVPLEAFGLNNKGLLIGMTKAEFDAAVAAANKPAG